jgi:hypothetical protein
VTIKRWRWHDVRGANGLWWRGMTSGSRHPMTIWASWLLSCASTSLAGSHDKIFTLQKSWAFWAPKGPYNIKI